MMRILVAVLGTLSAISSAGCGYSQAELDKQKAEAYQSGFTAGTLKAKITCDAQISELRLQQVETVKRLEAENSTAYWLGIKFGSDATIAITAIGLILLLIPHVGTFVVGGFIFAPYYFFALRRKGVEDKSKDWQSRKPPPSVTAL